MGSFLGLDVGTTTVTAIVVDSETGDVRSRATAPNDPEVPSVEDKRQGRSEWDAGQVIFPPPGGRGPNRSLLDPVFVLTFNGIPNGGFEKDVVERKP